MAFRLFRCTEVGGELLGGHHHFALQHYCRADAFEHDAQHAYDGVHLRQVTAVGAEFLPDVRHRVDAEHFDAKVGEAEHAGEHRHEHVRVAVVQIPLERVERGEHPLVHPFVPGEVAGGGGREDFRHHGVVLVGNSAVVVAVVVILIFRIARLSRLSPTMAGCGVVHHEVEAQADAGRTQFFGERREVFISTERRIDGVEIFHRITAVVLRMRHFQQWHKVQIRELLLFQVRHLACEFL